jgi:RNA polymerase sigma-54 factor
MRLSFGQQMQLAQKQVLAPRMIQSMEILQLPLMALQERIEQEMEDNPVLDQVEVDADEPEPPPEVEPANRLEDTERSWSSRKHRQCGRFRAARQHAENLPDDYEERSRRRSIASRPGRPRRRDGHMLARRSRSAISHHREVVWLDDAVRRWPSGSSSALTRTVTSTPLEELLPPSGGGQRRRGASRGNWRLGALATAAARPPRRGDR